MTPNRACTASLAFLLREHAPDAAGRLLRDLVPKLYGYARKECGHADALAFAVGFVSQVCIAMREPAGHG